MGMESGPRYEGREGEGNNERQKEHPRPPESFEDLRTTAEFLESSQGFREGYQSQTEEIDGVVNTLREREATFGNFSSPENLLGTAPIVRGDGMTMTSDILSDVEGFQTLTTVRRQSFDFIATSLQIGERWQDIRTHGNAQSFLSGAEGKYLLAITEGGMDREKARLEYILMKARELRDSPLLTRHGGEIADKYYVMLAGTPYEEIAKKESRSWGEKVSSGSRDIVNLFLSLDQLAILVLAGPIGRGVGAMVSRSEKATAVVATGLEAVNTSRAGKILVPGVEVFARKEADGTLARVLKVGGNLTLDISKFVAYESLARESGNEEFAKACAVVLMLLPGVKAGLEEQIGRAVATEKHAEAIREYLKQVLDTQGEAKLREDLTQAFQAQQARQAMRDGELTSTHGARLSIENDEVMRRLLNVLKGELDGGTLRSGHIVEKKHGNIDQSNPVTADIDRRLHSPEEAIVKPRTNPRNPKEIQFLSSHDYLPAFSEGLGELAQIMRPIDDWAILSSGATYLNNPELKTIPGDLDLSVRSEDFYAIYARLKSYRGIDALKVTQISSPDKNIDLGNTVEIDRLRAAGDLRFAFVIPTSKKIDIDVELFVESPGKGLTQLGTIPRVLEAYGINGAQLKALGLFDVADGYTMNFLVENAINAAGKTGKVKDAVRIGMLLNYMRGVGIDRPQNIIEQIDRVVSRYSRAGKENLSPYVRDAIANAESAKEQLQTIIRQYERAMRISRRGTEKLPDFDTFIADWGKKKEDLKKIFLEAEKATSISPERRSEITQILTRTKSRVETQMQQVRNDSEFAYFYELSIIEKRYIEEIRQKLKTIK